MTNRYFTSGAGYAAPDLLGNGDSFDGIVMIEANFDVAVDVVAEASAQFKSLAAAYSESAGGSAYADPTFAIDDPAFADYTIVGVPVGPAAATAPEPADLGARLRGTWLRGAPQGEEQRPFGPITKAGHLRLPASAIAENVEHERPAINV